MSEKISALTAWDGYPDGDLSFPAAFEDSENYKVTGDEMRLFGAETLTATSGRDSQSMRAFAINTASDITLTINASTPVAGHSIAVYAVQASGGTGHKVLLPTGVFWGISGSNRAALLNTADEYLFAIAFDIGGTIRFLVFASNGVTYAAS